MGGGSSLEPLKAAAGGEDAGSQGALPVPEGRPERAEAKASLGQRKLGQEGRGGAAASQIYLLPLS